MYLTQTHSKVGILLGHANRVLMAHKMKVEKRKLDQALTKDAEGQTGASQEDQDSGPTRR